MQITKQDITHAESPTVKQIRIAFEQTPSKLRAAEQGWRERRKEIAKRIQSDQATRTTEKRRIEVKVGHQAEYPAVRHANPKVMASAKPTTSPPTPPQTPPARQGNTQSKDLDRSDAPRPILAHPLAPTLSSIHLGRNGSLSIPHPSSPHELEVQIGKQHISVLRGGDTLEIGTKAEQRTICRKDYRNWSSTERKQWEMVRDLIEQVKRKTPRVSGSHGVSGCAEPQIKIYHPSALITITCSSPPDVIIAFTMSPDPPHSKRATSKTKSITTVKLVYSPLRGKITIDTDDKHREKGGTTFRTRRSIPLPPSHLEKLVARKGISSANAALGLSIDRSWLATEVEAVNRVWALRDEWLR
jgi:hypothetical protein